MANISQKQELRQQLSPKQILQASILQLNLPLLEQRIFHELEINPALELVELSKEDYEKDADQVDELESDEQKDKDQEEEFDWEELLGEHEDYENPPIAKHDEDKKELPIIAQESFSDIYLKQLEDINASPKKINDLLVDAHSNKLKMENIISNLNNNKKIFINNETDEYISIVINKIKDFKIEYLKIFIYWCTSYHFKINITQQSRQFWFEFSKL